MTIEQFTTEVFNIALAQERKDNIADVRWLTGDDACIKESFDTGLTPQDHIDEQMDAIND